MFTYLNPDVRQRLIKQGKLTRIDQKGNEIPESTLIGDENTSIRLLGPIPLPLSVNGKHYHAQWYAAVRNTEIGKVETLANDLLQEGGQNLFATLATPMAVNSVLVFGEPTKSDNPLIRVHSNCLTGDVFGSQRCECGPQLDLAIERIGNEESGGLVVYMAGHEGRGIGLWAKAATYLLQDSGENTYQANESLGLPVDSRDFSDAASLILRFIGDRPFRLMTNNPKKVGDLSAHGLHSISIEKHVTGVTTSNLSYLNAKKKRGHKLVDADLESVE
ncbi:MAG: GTP cyclohydrolase II RibA [Gammaproteobacteria bacterium]|nr:GTP cyclohydrolase II RibA [Gammaproteobacteria bacterium]